MQGNARYDLEERTLEFAKNIRSFVKSIQIKRILWEDIKQLIRSSGSVGANYIEANDSLGKGNFRMHLKIARKEAKESAYWLKLICHNISDEDRDKGLKLCQEAYELNKILSAIILKAK